MVFGMLEYVVGFRDSEWYLDLGFVFDDIGKGIGILIFYLDEFFYCFIEI